MIREFHSWLYIKENENTNSKTIWTPTMFLALFTQVKIWKQPMCLSIDDWLKEMWYIYTIESYAAIKKE